MNSYETNLALLKSWHSMCDYLREKKVQHPWLSGNIPTLEIDEEGAFVSLSRECDYQVSKPEDVVAPMLTWITNCANSFTLSGKFPQVHTAPINPNSSWRKKIDNLLQVKDQQVEAYARPL